jgi:hypothetical protein
VTVFCFNVPHIRVRRERERYERCKEKGKRMVRGEDNEI